MFKEIMNAYMEATGGCDSYKAGYEIERAMYDYDEEDWDDEDEYED